MLYIVPSRGRPHNVEQLLEAWEATRGCAYLWICVDDDDPQLEAYEKLTMPEWAKLRVAPRMRLGPTINHYTTEYLSTNYPLKSLDMIGFMGDDHRPRTKDWDLKILGAAHAVQDIGVIYGNDLIQGKNLPTSVAITTNVINELGYFCPPGVMHLYLDNAWADIGRALEKLIYLPGVIIEHCHPIANKGVQWDDGYREVNSGQMYDKDNAAYMEWSMNGEWRERLKAL